MKCIKKKTQRRTGNTNRPDNPQGSGASNSELRYFYPWAQWLPDKKLLKTKWTLDFAKPEDIIILLHHVAGHQEQKAKDFFSYFLREGLCTDFLDHTGQVWQQRHGDRVGSNAGTSKFEGRSSVSKFAIAIEIASAGKLKLRKADGQIVSWNKKYIPEGAQLVAYFGKTIYNYRYVTTLEGYQETGWYQCFTPLQERELIRWIKYWVSFGIPLKNIVGHDEVAGKKFLGYQRKNDIGGCLSLPLNKFVEKYIVNGEQHPSEN